MIEEYSNIPELPDAKKQRFIEEFNIKEYDASILTSTKEVAQFFEDMMRGGISAKNAVSWLNVELQGRFKEGMTVTDSPVNAQKLMALVKAIEIGEISGKAAKEVLDYLMEHDVKVENAIEKLGLKQMSDDTAILDIVNRVISQNPEKVEQYKAGKDKLFGFFVGQVMKESKGSANPQVVNTLLKELLS